MNHYSYNPTSQVFRMKKLSEKVGGKNITLKAARHNLREIQAEQGAQSHIDPSKTHLNRILEGAGDSKGVADDATQLMADANIGRLRKDAVLGIEILISLPSFERDDIGPFFNDALAWVKEYFKAPILSAVIHMDESCPHCHIILLPLCNGKMNGSKLMGYKTCLKATKEAFHEKVGQRYGLNLESCRRAYSRTTKEHMGRRAVCAIRSYSQHLDNPVIVEALEKAVSVAMPLALFNELSLEIPVANKKAKPSFVSIMTKPCKPEGNGRSGK